MNNNSINTIYESVVRIEANTIQFQWTAPFVKSRAPSASGTGFIIDKLGHIVTCFHVVDQAVHLFVTMPKSGQERIPAKIVAIYPEMDIAIIKINIKGPTKFLGLGNSDNVNIGREVLAIGYPLGQDKLKITKGIISGVQNNYIQTDAPINPGNSGGPLLYNGTVIGINTAKVAEVGTEGVGYANPINILKSVQRRMLSSRAKPITDENSSIVSYLRDGVVKIESSSLGILVDKCTKEIMSYIHCECPSGIQITSIFKNSPLLSGEYPAKVGDILCSIEDYEIDNNGECSVPWNREKVYFNDVFDRISVTKKDVKITYYTVLDNILQKGGLILSLEELLKTVVGTKKGKKSPTYKTIGKMVTKNVPIVSAKSIFKIWNYFPPYDEVKYVAFAGLVMMNLAMNHIVMKEFQYLFYNYVDKLDKNAVLITKVLPSTARIDGILGEGDVLKEVNGIPIEKIEDVQEALMKPIHKVTKGGKVKCYVTYKTTLGKFYCVDLKKAIKEDVQLFQYLNYEPSEATKYFIKFQDTEPCLKASKEDKNSNTNVFNL
jgi:S1-C subfamily serine protease